MSIFTSIGNLITGGLVKDVGDIIAKTNTTDKERLELQNETIKIVQDYQLKLVDALQGAEDELTERLKADMASDSWLSKNIRPLVCAFLTVMTVMLAYLTIFALPADKVTLLRPWLDLLTSVLLTVYAFYFGSRGIEKIGQIVTTAWQNKSTTIQGK